MSWCEENGGDKVHMMKGRMKGRMTGRQVGREEGR